MKGEASKPTRLWSCVLGGYLCGFFYAHEMLCTGHGECLAFSGVFAVMRRTPVRLPYLVAIFSEGNQGENDLKRKIWGRLNLEEAGTDN